MKEAEGERSEREIKVFTFENKKEEEKALLHQF